MEVIILSLKLAPKFFRRYLISQHQRNLEFPTLRFLVDLLEKSSTVVAY